MKKISLIVLITTYQLLFTFALPAFAQTMTNSFFKIIMGNLNMAAGNVANSVYNLSLTAGQTAPGLYVGTNYKVKAGFQYVRPGKIAFVFTLSPNLIDFGVITPTNPITRTVNLTISSGSAKGFTVIASENQPLTSQNSVIPNTTCDNGDCSTLKATSWASSLAYGFGYRCDNIAGTNCSTIFSDTFYKPFALSPTSDTIMRSTTGGKSRKSQLTYKVNVSGSQTPGLYTNIVTYIAAPGF